MAQDASRPPPASDPAAVAPGEGRSRRTVLVAIGALLLGLLLAALDQTIVSTALPTIVSDLGGLEHLSWVVTAYLLAATASTPLWGKLGDQYGRKRLFQAAIVIFLTGSALCGLARNMPELIGFRAVQGLGGGGLISLSMAIVGDIVTPRERGRYQGMFGAVFGASSVLGPLLGGLFVDHLSWRWAFYINVPIGVMALLVIAAVLHIPVRGTRHTIDYLGTLLIASVATSLVLMASLGGVTYAWDSWRIIGLGVLGAVLLVAFIRVERRAAEPVLPLKLFRGRTFALCSVRAEPARLAEHVSVLPSVVTDAARNLEDRRLAVREGAGTGLVLTDGGRQVAGLLLRAREETLAELLGDWWSPRRPTDLITLVRELNAELCGSDAEQPRDGDGGGSRGHEPPPRAQ